MKTKTLITITPKYDDDAIRYVPMVDVNGTCRVDETEGVKYRFERRGQDRKLVVVGYVHVNQ